MHKGLESMTLFHVDRMVVSRSPFGSDLRFVGPHGEFLGMGRPRTHLFGFAGPKGLSLHLLADPAGQEEVLTIHRRALLNQAAPVCVVDAATGEKCASLQLIMAPRVSWQIADAEQQPLGTVVADHGDAQTAVVQFDDRVACRVARSQRIGGFGTATWEVEFDRFAADPERRRVVLAAVLLLMVCAWPGGIVSKNILRTLSWIFGACLCVAGLGTVVVVAVFSAIHGGNLPWIAYAVPGLVALLGLAMMVVRFRI